jgi:hypothetical protein
VFLIGYSGAEPLASGNYSEDLRVAKR